MKADTVTTRRTSTDPAEPWLVVLVVMATMAAGVAVRLCWQLVTGGAW